MKLELIPPLLGVVIFGLLAWTAPVPPKPPPEPPCRTEGGLNGWQDLYVHGVRVGMWQPEGLLAAEREFGCVDALRASPVDGGAP